MRKKSFVFRLFSASIVAAYLFAILAPERIITKAVTDAVEAKGECVMEVNSRRVLYQSHGDIRLPMASTTKILTCITVLESVSLNEKVTIPLEATGIEGSSVYLKEGEVYTVEDLLYGLMLRSGNDCATALAIYCCGSIEKFSAKMNETAQKAGALASNFENPHGLPEKEHYTTAYDLGLITAYAMQNPTFRQIVATQYYQPKGWKNKNKMLTLYDGGIGVKTGYTKEAGRCLVSAAERGGMTLVCVVLNCSTTYERSAELLNDAFENYEYTRLLSTNEKVDILEMKTQGHCKKDYYYPLLKEEKSLIEIKTKALKSVGKEQKIEKIIGEFEIYLSNRLLFSGNLYKL